MRMLGVYARTFEGRNKIESFGAAMYIRLSVDLTRTLRSTSTDWAYKEFFYGAVLSWASLLEESYQDRDPENIVVIELVRSRAILELEHWSVGLFLENNPDRK